MIRELISSFLAGMIRINFQPYNTQQLMEIVSSRIATSREGLKADAPQVIAPDSLKLAAMKVASISGDARRVLDICRSVLPNTVLTPLFYESMN